MSESHMKKRNCTMDITTNSTEKADNNTNHRSSKSIKCGKSNLPFFHSFSHVLGNADVF